MKVLITGGGGFIGSHLVEEQLRKGREVRTIDLNVSCLKQWDDSSQFQIVQGDIRDKELMQNLLSGVDVVFHLASAHLSITTSEEEYWEINVKTTEELAKLCQIAGVKRLVHCSSVGIYGEIKNPPANEESPCNPDLTYEKTKLAGEQALFQFYQDTSYPIAIVRPVWVYGPRCPRTAKLFRTIRNGRFIIVGNGQTLRHCIYISDLLEGFELCAQHEEAIGQAFIIGDNSAITVQQLLEEIASVMNVPPPKMKVPLWAMYPVCMFSEALFNLRRKEPPLSKRSLKFFTNNTSFEITKAKTLLKFAPQVCLRDGLERTYNYIRAEYDW